jgi:hypothetical protein
MSFWGIFNKSSHCANPRDRIYSILAIIEHDSTFQVDYSENIVDTFWRSAEQFSGWCNVSKLTRLWRTLELDHQKVLAVAEGLDNHLYDAPFPCAFANWLAILRTQCVEVCWSNRPISAGVSQTVPWSILLRLKALLAATCCSVHGFIQEIGLQTQKTNISYSIGTAPPKIRSLYRAKTQIGKVNNFFALKIPSFGTP